MHAALLSLAALAAAAPVTEQTYSVPIGARRSLQKPDGKLDPYAFIHEMQRAISKYNPDIKIPAYEALHSSGQLFRRATGTVPLTDQVEQGQDEEYYGPGTVGGQSGFSIDFDTGSADFFVPGPTCGAAQGCNGNVKYAQKGQSEGNTTSVTYGSGQVSGNNYFDTVSVAGLTATHTNVISLTQASGFNTSSSNSLMGMGFSTIAESKQPTFFENLIAQKVVSQPEFGFFLGRAASNTQGQSELFLGGANPAKYTGTLTAVPVTQKGYWQVALKNVVVNGSPSLLTAGQAAIDTGTTIILAPTVAATSIFSSVPGSSPIPLTSEGGINIYGYPCNSPPKVSITFGSKQYAINPLDFNLGEVDQDFFDILGLPNPFGGSDAASSGPTCAAAIGGADINPLEELYVVGDTFLKNWYAVFNYNGAGSVSFAAAKGNQ